jgi:putrescine aminotransferase
VAKALFGRGILISGTYINAQVLRVEPPLTISYPEIDKFLAALEASLAEVQKEHRL